MKSESYLKTTDKEARAWGEYLSKYQWDYFGTFTFSERYSANGARRAFERFIADSEFPPVVSCFYGIERGDRYGKIHLHSLLQFSPECRPTARFIWDRWFNKKGYGAARVEIPDSQIDVAAYCAKYTSKKMVDYDIIGKPHRIYDGKR